MGWSGPCAARRATPDPADRSALDRVHETAQERQVREVLDQDRLTPGVGERNPPVGVLLVGARLVLGAPVADRVGFMAKLNDPSRRLLGEDQLAWLERDLAAAARAGTIAGCKGQIVTSKIEMEAL